MNKTTEILLGVIGFIVAFFLAFKAVTYLMSLLAR